MLMTDLVNESFLAPLRWLGNYRWVTYKPMGVCEGVYRSRVSLTPPKEMPLYVRQFILPVQRQPLLMPELQHHLLYLYGVSKALASGPKLIRPTYEQCVALEHCEARLPFSEYEQRTLSVIIELPEEWRDAQYERLKSQLADVPPGWDKPPKYVVVFHDRDTGCLRTDAIADEGGGPRWNNTMSALHRGQTIEDALRLKSFQSGPDLEMSLADERLGINLCLMMTCYGARDLGPLHPKSRKAGKHKAFQKTGSRKRTRMLARGINLLAFDQEVTFFQHLAYDDKDGEPGEGTHASPRPHWRRGHFRRVPCGHGRAERKLVFIKPTLVSKRFFAGNLADTRTTYEIAKPAKGSGEPDRGESQ